MRVGKISVLLNFFLPKIDAMMLGEFNNIGPGFNLVHGFSTVINGSFKIGKNCTILRNVTIGVGNF